MYRFTVLNKGMALTAKDLKLIEEVVTHAIDNNPNIAKKDDMAFLPSKDDFYNQTDKIMGELKGIREQHEMLSNRVYENLESRMVTIEKKLNISPTV